jgi:hypothetical protein
MRIPLPDPGLAMGVRSQTRNTIYFYFLIIIILKKFFSYFYQSRTLGPTRPDSNFGIMVAREQ